MFRPYLLLRSQVYYYYNDWSTVDVKFYFEQLLCVVYILYILHIITEAHHSDGVKLLHGVSRTLGSYLKEICYL